MNADCYREYLGKLRVKLARLKLQAETAFNESTLGFHKGEAFAYTDLLARTGSNDSFSEGENYYRKHLTELVVEIIELAADAKYKLTKAKSQYTRGRLAAYATFLDTMKVMAVHADFDEADIGLNRINPLKDFLGIKY